MQPRLGEASWVCVTLSHTEQNIGKAAFVSNECLYFIGQKGSVCRFDLNLFVKSAESRRSFRSKFLPTGTVVDFYVEGKNRVVSLSE